MRLELIGEVLETDVLVDAINNAEEDIELVINSEGGAVLGGLQVVNAIQNCKHKVIAKVEVMACSIAFVIAMSCDECKVTKNVIGMAHNSWTMAVGNKKDLEKEIECMKTIDTILQNIISEHCYDDSIKARMEEGDVWLTGEEMAALFDNVQLVEKENHLGMVASGCLVDLLAKFNILQKEVNDLKEAEKTEEKEQETEEETEKPAEEEKKEEEEKKDYVVPADLLNLLNIAENLE